MAEPEPFAWQDTEVIPGSGTPEASSTGRREVERTPLVAGVLFIVRALLLMSGVDLGAVWDRGLVWVLLIGGGVTLLVSELRRGRRRRS